MPRLPSNKLTLYLIKDRYTDFSEILKDEDKLVALPLEGVGTFYYAKSQIHPPGWIRKFFQDSLNDVTELYSSTANGLLLARVGCTGDIERIFAISFGHGWQFLKNNACEERFGLKVTLNIIDPDSLKKVNKKSMSSNPKDTSEQLAKAGAAADFGIDIEQDLVMSVCGTSNNETFGKTVEGKTGLSISAQVNLTTLTRFLKLCYERYISPDYKTNFGWVDQIAEIRDENIIEGLDKQLLENIKSGTSGKTWMAVPEIVDWTNIQGFGYQEQPIDLKDDINLDDFLAFLSPTDKTRLTVENLYEQTTWAFNNSDTVRHQWSIYECLYCEITNDDKTYLLSNGKWYEIDKAFVDIVDINFSQAVQNPTIALPEYHHDNEADYNIKVPTEQSNYHCMDKDLIYHGGTYGKIEFCDLITNDKKIIHVKHYGGSSVLSHLFAQGMISGELFLSDSEFREKLNGKLPQELKLQDFSVKPNPSDYQIVFAVISEKPGDLEIPFFSKVNFRNTKRRLETFGYKVSIIKIAVS